MQAYAQDRWALVRRLYEGDVLTVDEIAAIAGVSPSAIFRHVRQEGWASSRRPGKKHFAPVPPTPALAAVAGAVPTGEVASPEEVLRRLWAVLDAQVTALEGAGGAPADLRLVAGATQAVERLLALERGMAEERGSPDADEEPDDIDSLVAELARRLEALP